MTAAPAPRFLTAGESALAVEYGSTIDPAINERVLALDAALAATPLEGVVETVPTYRSLMIHFNPRTTTPERIVEAISSLDLAPRGVGTQRRWCIPVCYDPSLAEDLGAVAASLGLAEERVAALHAEARYRVYMYGFAPGFTFLGGLPPELSISRRATPRPPAPPGSLLIAGGQALIASIAMPTGWYVLGQTPVRVFDPAREPPFLADAGDEVVFERIDLATFDALRRDADEGQIVARVESL